MACGCRKGAKLSAEELAQREDTMYLMLNGWVRTVGGQLWYKAGAVPHPGVTKEAAVEIERGTEAGIASDPEAALA